MTFQRQTDKNLFRFHIIFPGMNPINDNAHSRTKENIREIRHIYLDLGGLRRFTARATAPGRTFRMHTKNAAWMTTRQNDSFASSRKYQRLKSRMMGCASIRKR